MNVSVVVRHCVFLPPASKQAAFGAVVQSQVVRSLRLGLGRSRLHRGYCGAALLPDAGVAGQVIFQGTDNFLNIYNSILVARLVLTW